MFVTRLFDFGLVVLIWIVQLIIYPGFKYYKAEALVEWHATYTRNITYIVLPLMLGQLVLHGWSTWNQFNWLKLALLVMVIATWGITFTYAVPLHGKISAGEKLPESIQSLLNINWSRTILWTLIFMLGLIDQAGS